MPPVGYRICNTYHSFSAPIPPTPFPGGEGGDLGLFYARGFAPCIPGAEPGRHLQNLPSRFPEWGCAPCEAEFGRHSGARRGRSGFGRLPTLPLAYFSAPIPLPPFPTGRGRTKVFLCKGLRPLHPQGCTHGSPRKRQEAVLYEQCRQPRRGGTGGEELRRLRWSSPPGQGEQVPRGGKPPCPPPGTTAARIASAARGNPPCHPPDTPAARIASAA